MKESSSQQPMDVKKIIGKNMNEFMTTDLTTYTKCSNALTLSKIINQ